MVEITDIKCGHLFQKTQQHGGCTSHKKRKETETFRFL